MSDWLIASFATVVWDSTLSVLQQFVCSFAEKPLYHCLILLLPTGYKFKIEKKIAFYAIKIAKKNNNIKLKYCSVAFI